MNGNWGRPTQPQPAQPGGWGAPPPPQQPQGNWGGAPQPPQQQVYDNSDVADVEFEESLEFLEPGWHAATVNCVKQIVSRKDGKEWLIIEVTSHSVGRRKIMKAKQAGAHAKFHKALLKNVAASVLGLDHRDPELGAAVGPDVVAPLCNKLGMPAIDPNSLPFAPRNLIGLTLMLLEIGNCEAPVAIAATPRISKTQKVFVETIFYNAETAPMHVEIPSWWTQYEESQRGAQWGAPAQVQPPPVQQGWGQRQPPVRQAPVQQGWGQAPQPPSQAGYDDDIPF